MSTPDELREAERAKDANPCPETWAALAAVRERVGWRSPRQIKQDTLTRLMAENKHPTKEIAVLAGEVGGSFWAGDHLNGPVQEFRVNGKCQTWVREPERFELPVKSGWNDHTKITQYNCTSFTTRRPLRPCDVVIRRVELSGDYVKGNVLGVSQGTYFGQGEKLWAVQVTWPHNMTENGVVRPYPWGAPHRSDGREDLYVLRSHDRDSIRYEVREALRAKGFATLFRK